MVFPCMTCMIFLKSGMPPPPPPECEADVIIQCSVDCGKMIKIIESDQDQHTVQKDIITNSLSQ